MPSFGMYTAEGKLVAWLEPDRAQVKQGQPILEIETEKAVERLVAPAAGVLHQITPPGTQVKEEALLGYILRDGEALPAAGTASGAPTRPAARESAPSAPPPPPSSSSTPPARIIASPIARRLAAEAGLDLGGIAGTGPGGRIVEADVKAAVAKGTAGSSAGRAVSVQLAIRQRVALSPMRRAIGRRLRESLNQAVSLTLTREVEVDGLVLQRQQLSSKHGFSIPFDAFFIYFLARGLREYPPLNAFMDGDSLLLLDEVNVAVAVSVEEGLVTPVVRAADKQNIVELARRVRELADAARNGRISNADLEGGTVTITNLGGFGVDAFTPVLNPPQSCILGVGRIQPRPIVRAGQLSVAQTCMLSLTFDHRATDGVPAAKLLDSLARQLNDPNLLEAL